MGGKLPQSVFHEKNIVSKEALDSIQALLVLQELNAEPTTDEFEKAINALASTKAPGNDAIPSEVIKEGTPALLPHFHELMHLCWKEGEVPQERD